MKGKVLISQKNREKRENENPEEMTIKEVLQKYPQTFSVFISYGLYCVGCPIAQLETIEEMAKAYGFDLEKFLNDLNKVIEKE